MKNKKGSMRDTLLIVVLGFGLVMASLFALKVINVVNDKFQSTSMVPAEAKASMNTITVRMPKWIDGAFILFWVMMMIFGLFLALQINTNPVFLPISIIYFIFLIFISKVFASIYTKMAASTALAAEAASLSIIPYILPRLPIFSFIFGAVIIGVMVIKR